MKEYEFVDKDTIISDADIGDRIIAALTSFQSRGQRAFDIVIEMLAKDIWEAHEDGRRLRGENQPMPKPIDTWARARMMGWRSEDVLLEAMNALRKLEEGPPKVRKSKPRKRK